MATESRGDPCRQERQRKLTAATVAFVQPGQMQTERDFNMQGENSSPAQLLGHFGRRGTSWFSFDVPVDSAHPMTLVVTYNRGEQQNRTFDILVESVKVGEQSIPRLSPEQQNSDFFDVEYKVPAELVKGKQKVTVRFQATNGNAIGTIYGIRMIRADAER